MENVQDICALSKFKKYSPATQAYLENHFQSLESHGKGFGTTINIHVYKDLNGNKCESNLICYMILNPETHDIELQECKITKEIKKAELFKKLNAHVGTIYNVDTNFSTQPFDTLIKTIESI